MKNYKNDLKDLLLDLEKTIDEQKSVWPGFFGEKLLKKTFFVLVAKKNCKKDYFLGKSLGYNCFSEKT